jgi:hypothetical protein
MKRGRRLKPAAMIEIAKSRGMLEAQAVQPEGCKIGILAVTDQGENF